MKNLILIGFYLMMISSCAVKNGVSIQEEDKISGTAQVLKLPAPEGLDLTEYIRRFAGVSIVGSGPNAKIEIRGGNRSLMNASASDPLYVIDGMVFNGSYSQLYSAVNVNYIDQLVVYKDASDLTYWGSRGANGVIEIKLKKQ